MKHYVLSLVFILSVSASLLLNVFPAKALAAGDLVTTEADVKAATFTWVNAGEITASIPVTGSTTPYTITFKSTAPNDGVGFNGQTTEQYVGTDPCGDGQNATIWANPADPSTKINQGTMYYKLSANGTCNTLNYDPNGNEASIGDTDDAKIIYEFTTSTSIGRIDGNSSYTFTEQGSSDVYVRSSGSGADCTDVIVVSSSGAANSAGNLWELNAGSGSQKVTNTSFGAQGCYVSSENDDVGGTNGDAQSLVGAQLQSSGSDAGSYALYIGGTPTTAPKGGAGAGGSALPTSPTINCSVTIFNPISWFLCPLAVGLEGLAGSLDNAINSALTIGTSGWKGSYYNAWSSIRDIALGLIVIAGLVAIISQASGFEFLDAYTIRKALPRVLIVAIGISISWPVMKEFVWLTNDLGNGVRSIIYLGAQNATGGTENVKLGGGSTAVIGIIAAIAVSPLGVGFVGLLSFAATAALAASVAFLVLILRQMIIVMLVIFSPIALACYVLPHTQKVWKLWWDSFSKGLLMFPLIAGFIAIGRVFAAVSSQNKDPIWQIISFVSYFAPYFLIPFTFRLAGGAIANIGGFVNDRHRGAFDAVKNFRSNRTKTRRANLAHDAKAANIFRGAPEGSRRAKFNNAVQTATLMNDVGYRPSQIRSRIEANRGAATLAHMNEQAEKSQAYKTFAANDTLINAANHGNGTEADWRAYLEAQGQTGSVLDQNVGLIRAAKRDMGESFGIAAAVANFGTGTGFSLIRDANGNVTGGGIGAGLEAISKAADGNMVVAGAAIAQAKQRAEQSRRFDLSGAGYGDLYDSLGRINRAQTAGQAQAVSLQETELLGDRALDSNGAGAMLGGRGNSVEALIPAMQRRVTTQMDEVHVAHAALQAAQATGFQPDIDVAQTRVRAAQRGAQQVFAETAGLLDVAGQVSPENARMLADGVMNMTINDVNGRSASLGEVIDMNRSNTEFDQMRREMMSQTAGQYQAAQQRAAAATAAAGMPGGNIPGGNIPGAGPVI
jgi:hypothetical protein